MGTVAVTIWDRNGALLPVCGKKAPIVTIAPPWAPQRSDRRSLGIHAALRPCPLRRRWRAPAPMSSSSPAASSTGPSRARTATGSTSCSTGAPRHAASTRSAAGPLKLARARPGHATAFGATCSDQPPTSSTGSGSASRARRQPARHRRSGPPRVFTVHYPLPSGRRDLAARARAPAPRWTRSSSTSEHGARPAARRRRARSGCGPRDPARRVRLPHAPARRAAAARRARRRRGPGDPVLRPAAPLQGHRRPARGVPLRARAPSSGSSGCRGCRSSRFRSWRARAAGRVRLLPRFITDPEIPALFRRADVVVLPYREIEQSGVLYTALAFGKPIVLSAVGGFTEVGRAAGAAHAGPARRPGCARRGPLRMLSPIQPSESDSPRRHEPRQQGPTRGMRSPSARSRSTAPSSRTDGHRPPADDSARIIRSCSPSRSPSGLSVALLVHTHVLLSAFAVAPPPFLGAVQPPPARRDRRRRGDADGVADRRRARRGGGDRGEGSRTRSRSTTRASGSSSSSPPTAPPTARSSWPRGCRRRPRAGSAAGRQDRGPERGRRARAAARCSPSPTPTPPGTRTRLRELVARVRRSEGRLRLRPGALRRPGRLQPGGRLLALRDLGQRAGVGRRRGHRRQRQRSTRCAARPTSRWPPSRSHDLSFPFELTKQGWRAVYVPAAVAEERLVPTIEGEFHRKRRMMQRALGHRRPRRDGVPARLSVALRLRDRLPPAAPLPLARSCTSLAFGTNIALLGEGLGLSADLRRSSSRCSWRQRSPGCCRCARCASPATTCSSPPRSPPGSGTGRDWARPRPGRSRRGRADAARGRHRDRRRLRLLVSAPLLAVAAVAIKLDSPGPVDLPAAPRGPRRAGVRALQAADHGPGLRPGRDRHGGHRRPTRASPGSAGRCAGSRSTSSRTSSTSCAARWRSSARGRRSRPRWSSTPRAQRTPAGRQAGPHRLGPGQRPRGARMGRANRARRLVRRAPLAVARPENPPAHRGTAAERPRTVVGRGGTAGAAGLGGLRRRLERLEPSSRGGRLSCATQWPPSACASSAPRTPPPSSAGSTTGA